MIWLCSSFRFAPHSAQAGEEVILSLIISAFIHQCLNRCKGSKFSPKVSDDNMTIDESLSARHRPVIPHLMSPPSFPNCATALPGQRAEMNLLVAVDFAFPPLSAPFNLPTPANQSL